MIGGKKDLILKELEEGTGAAMAAAVDRGGLRSSVRIWFADLDERHGPVAEIRPYGLKGHQIMLTFGNFSGEVIEQIQRASAEDVQLAQALVASIRTDIEVEISGQDKDDWCVNNGSFRMQATIRNQEQPYEDEAVVASCREVIVPMMAAMAELIGYDEIELPERDESSIPEGAILQSVVRRRERNPRNRLLCIRIHGERCAVCSVEPKRIYGVAGSIIEVHHLEPLALVGKPRLYDPRKDLVPLCPSCHRAVHSRRPIPFCIEEIQALMESCVE